MRSVPFGYSIPVLADTKTHYIHTTYNGVYDTWQGYGVSAPNIIYQHLTHNTAVLTLFTLNFTFNVPLETYPVVPCEVIHWWI